MKYKNIRLYCVSTICILTLFFNVSISGQTRQARGFQQPLNEVRVDGNSKAYAEIEMMQEMIRQRRAQQEQQQALLQELRDAINAASPASPQYQEQHQDWIEEDPVSQRQRVTSGSTLSIIEAQEREDINILEQKFNMEIQVAQREIEMLKKQLEIANRQLSQCQAGAVTYNTASNTLNNTANTVPRTVSRAQPQVQPQRDRAVAQKTKSPKAKKQNVAKKEEKSQSRPQQTQPSAVDPALRAEIEMMQKMLQERKAQQAQQLKLIRDLEQAVGGGE